MDSPSPHKETDDSGSEEKSPVEHQEEEEQQEEKESVKSESPEPNEAPTTAQLFETDSEDDDDDEDDEDDEDDDDKKIHSSKKKRVPRIIEEDEDESRLAPSQKDDSDDDNDADKGEGVDKAKSKSKAKNDDDGDDDDNDDDGSDNDDKEEDDDAASGRNKEDEVDDADEGSPKRADRAVDDDDEGEDEEEEDEEEEDGPKSSRHTVYDFDIMMAKKKEENSRRRKRKNYDIINDNDDIIAEMINQMRDAVELDREANKNKQAATRKLKMLPFVVNQLRKVDLRDAFLDSDILSAITEWLAPLPDKSLPHLNIRENLLKILQDFHLYDVDRIRGSGIGKAVMYLYKHPRETKENKIRAKNLISSWSRPIFQLDSNFDAISREEREQRDLELMNKQNRVAKKPSDQKKTEDAPLKPGDKGWIPRARVPAPSMKDYVIRPASKVADEAFRTRSRPSIVFKNKLPRRRYV